MRGEKFYWKINFLKKKNLVRQVVILKNAETVQKHSSFTTNRI